MTAMEWVYLVGILAGLTIILYLIGILIAGRRLP